MTTIQHYKAEYRCSLCKRNISHYSQLNVPKVNIFVGVFFRYITKRIVEDLNNKKCSGCGNIYTLIGVELEDVNTSVM